MLIILIVLFRDAKRRIRSHQMRRIRKLSENECAKNGRVGRYICCDGWKRDIAKGVVVGWGREHA
jgi:hypothetical protein